MTKFSIDQKLKIVREYISGTSSSTLEKKYGVKNHFSIYNWSNRYKVYGIEGLKSRSTRIKYDGTFKLKVLKWKRDNHATYSETALHFDISNTGTIANWQKKYDVQGSVALFGEFVYFDHGEVEQSEVERLRYENRKLKTELDSLKKNNCFAPERKNIYVAEKMDCDAKLLSLIKDIKLKHRDYGYRSVTDELKKLGYSVNHKRVLRIMNENSLVCKNNKQNLIINEGSLQ